MSNSRPDAVEQHSFSTPLLDRIDSPQDLRQLGEDELLQLVQELRDFLLYTVSNCGGHFAASMGVAELTVALHYVFNTPDDRLVWDVGHQAYIHKILTGRKDLLHTIRQHNGLAPFPKRDESEYDTFGVGHSSTSAGAALGMSVAAYLQNNKRQCVAIIGDGGMTAGMAFEALNNAGDMHSDLLVILNDNNMSISPNVGALSNRWAQISTGKTWSKVRMQGKKVLSTHPEFSKLIKHAKGYAKSVMGAKGALF